MGVSRDLYWDTLCGSSLCKHIESCYRLLASTCIYNYSNTSLKGPIGFVWVSASMLFQLAILTMGLSPDVDQSTCSIRAIWLMIYQNDWESTRSPIPLSNILIVYPISLQAANFWHLLSCLGFSALSTLRIFISPCSYLSSTTELQPIYTKCEHLFICATATGEIHRVWTLDCV